jgi:ABC-type multidrug transport system ATPase subunit
MNAIEIKNLTKRFKDKVAVNNINLEVKVVVQQEKIFYKLLKKKNL